VHRSPSTSFHGVYAERHQLSLHDTNSAPIRNNNATGKQLYIQQLYIYTPLVIGGTEKNKQLNIAKPMQTGNNRNK
jgi:hypothetical protein